MPTYNSNLLAADADGLIPVEVSKEIISGTVSSSAVMKMARRAPNMASSKTQVPVLDLMPTAYFVSGEVGLKQTSELNWKGKYFHAEELAVIIPIPQAVLDDSAYDIWGEAKPRLVEAFGKTFDSAVFWGTNAPATWPTCLYTVCATTGNQVRIGSGTDLYEDIMGQNGVLQMVESDGFLVNGCVSAISMKGRLRNLRDSNGQPIFRTGMTGQTEYLLDGARIEFPNNGLFSGASALMFAGDWSQLMYTFRQDMTFKLFEEGAITDADGKVVLNLMQQDCVALRAVMRLAWEVPNPVNAENTTSPTITSENQVYTSGTRFPFATLLPEA